MFFLNYKKCKHLVFKLCLVTIIFIFSLINYGCSKNVDTYLNSHYFKENYSDIVINPPANTTTLTQTPALAKNVVPAIVAISAKSGNSTSIGSGVCVKSGGYILTNSHVVSDSQSITVFLSDNQTGEAIILWQDEIMDIAILKSSKSMPYLPMGDNSKTTVGEDVIAVGTPLSLNFTHTVTKGIVSAVNRTIKITTTRGEALMQNLIQHDASINPGNSGGPLINSAGEVIGINTLKITTAEGLGFAIPINSVVSVVDNVYNNYNYSTPFLGIYGYDASLDDNFNNVTQNKGMYVLSVADNSPAMTAGVKTGDVIVKVNNKKINTALDFRKELFKNNVNDKISLEVSRENEIHTYNIKLGRRPSASSVQIIS